MYFLVDDASFMCYLDVVEGMTFLVNFKNEQDLRNFNETVSDLKHTWVSLRDLVTFAKCFKFCELPIYRPR